MQGAREFARLFDTGQYGRLYIVSGYHARGNTFHIFVLPEGEAVIPNGRSNPPLNPDAVEVFGITGGHPGWTETYGWLHRGKWCDDFAELVRVRKQKIASREAKIEAEKEIERQENAKRVSELLARY